MTDWSNRFMPLLLASSTDCEYKNITIQIDWILKNRTHKSCHSKLEFLLFPFILIHKGRFYYYHYYLQIDIEMKFTQIINFSHGRKGKWERQLGCSIGLVIILNTDITQTYKLFISFALMNSKNLATAERFSPILVRAISVFYSVPVNLYSRVILQIRNSLYYGILIKG